jgi:hypothetical protein
MYEPWDALQAPRYTPRTFARLPYVSDLDGATAAFEMLSLVVMSRASAVGASQSSEDGE